METSIICQGIYWGYILGITEKNMETTIMDCCCNSCNCNSLITVQIVVPASCLLLVHDNLAPRAFRTSFLCGNEKPLLACATLNPQEDYSDGAAKPSFGRSEVPQAARYPYSRHLGPKIPFSLSFFLLLSLYTHIYAEEPS